VAELARWFPDSAHVGSLGLDTATDREFGHMPATGIT
jgi:hypothetical protein